MNRLFGTKKAPAPPQKPMAQPEEDTTPKYDLIEQQQKVENRVNDVDEKIKVMDQEIAGLYQ